jgi:cystathionine gamma-lyase
MLKLVDLAQVGEVCRKKGIISVCDNTFMTPYFQKPLELGIDVVAHSTTKYLNGHSDSVGGFACTNDKALADRIYFHQNAVGGIASPFDSFLVLRGVKTLHVRMERHQQNAGQLAAFLSEHPRAGKVCWPGLKSHPQHALAKKQMTGFGGMMTFEIKGGLEAARRFLKSVKIFACAESLGGVESLIEHPAIMTHASVPKETRETLSSPLGGHRGRERSHRRPEAGVRAGLKDQCCRSPSSCWPLHRCSRRSASCRRRARW